MHIIIVIGSILFTTSYMGVPSHIEPAPSQTKIEVQEERWKKFNECRDKFYTDYPDEMVETDWHKCMQKDYTKE